MGDTIREWEIGGSIFKNVQFKKILTAGKKIMLNLNVIVDDSGSMDRFVGAIKKFCVDLFKERNEILRRSRKEIDVRVNLYAVTTKLERKEENIRSAKEMEEKIRTFLVGEGGTDYSEAFDEIYKEITKRETGKRKEFIILLTDTDVIGGIGFLEKYDLNKIIVAVTAKTIEERKRIKEGVANENSKIAERMTVFAPEESTP